MTTTNNTVPAVSSNLLDGNTRIEVHIGGSVYSALAGAVLRECADLYGSVSMYTLERYGVLDVEPLLDLKGRWIRGEPWIKVADDACRKLR